MKRYIKITKFCVDFTHFTIVCDDVTGKFMSINDKYLIGGKLIKPLNSIDLCVSDTLEMCLSRTATMTEMLSHKLEKIDFSNLEKLKAYADLFEMTRKKNDVKYNNL